MKRVVVMSMAWALCAGFATFAGAAGPVGPAAGGPEWSYAGANGPPKWGKLGKENATCGTGQLQSPIDINDADVRKGDIPPLLFNYKTVPVRIIDNGHTIQVNYPPGSFLTVDGKRFELVQLDFHKPSEEKVNGKGHEMVAHLVHKGDNGKLAVVAVFLDPGNDNEVIKTLWKNLPATKGKEVVVESAQINALQLLPKNKDYYRLEGSLTTPPCTENVTWLVLKTPTQVSGDEIARFGRIYPNNARPVQPRNDRDMVGSASR
jgi:carbonic anhydrase